MTGVDSLIVPLDISQKGSTLHRVFMHEHHHFGDLKGQHFLGIGDVADLHKHLHTFAYVSFNGSG